MFAQRIYHRGVATANLSQSPSDRFMMGIEEGGKVNLLAENEERPEEKAPFIFKDKKISFENNRRSANKKRTIETTKMESTTISAKGEQKDFGLTTTTTQQKYTGVDMGAAEEEEEEEEEDVITIVPNEENRAEIRVTLKKPSLTMIQQHSLDSAPFKMYDEKMTTGPIHQQPIKAGNGIRRSSTTPSNNGRKLTLGYRYARRPTEASASFPIPPVFPKTCSLFDSTFSGGAFADSQEDKKLMDALVKVRRKISAWQQGGEQIEAQLMSQMAEDMANMSDSGHSSITEATSTSPPLSSFSFFGESNDNIGKEDVHSKESVFFNSTDNEDKFESEDGSRKKLKRKSDFGLNIRKNSRILFFRQRAKTNTEKRKNSVKSDINENENGRNNEELPSPPWTIDGTKGLSWKCKLLRTLSAAGRIHFAGVSNQEKGEKPSDHHFGKLDREWEVVTVRELCRRLSLEDSLEPSEMPLPEGALQSQVLDEFMLRQIVDILPPRAEGYPWVNIYNSEKHGFSLATLYRKMSEWKEEMSPVLLVIRDVQGHVFGAVTSTALRPSDHYYGTGDSCLLFRFTGEYPHTRELRTYNWTGNNQFFVNATKDFLSVGAGGGHYGLWLDADLNNGRSQKCATFDNEPLAGGQDEDFVIQFVEAFGFSM